MRKRKYPLNFYHDHTQEEIRKRLSQSKQQSYLSDFVYGAIDGTVTTFAVVSGVIGAGLESRTILILGFANLIADGFSMAAGNYLSTKTKVDEYTLVKEFELDQVRSNPEGEKEEVRQILMSKGFADELLEKATDLIVADRHQWVDFMMKEEYGFGDKLRSPVRSGAATFAAFLLAGLVPLLPFLMGMEHSFFGASIMTGVVFFLVGSLKSRWSTEQFWSSGLKTLSIGSAAAALAYFVGFLLKEVVS